MDTYATKFPDYTFLDLQLELDETVFRSCSTFCVEIKPKQGYLQEGEQKFSKCPYCLNQYAKLRRKNISTLSNYCPFNLFSGMEGRMKAAVKELLKSPQNNLKIFKDGFVVYNHTSSPKDLENVLNEWFRNAESGRRACHVDEFCNLICAALTRSIAQEQLKLPATPLSRNFLVPANQVPTTFCTLPDTIARAEWYLRLVGKKCNFNGNELPKNSVLERIWNMQRLSYVNINYIYSIYSKFASLLNDDMIYSDLKKLNKTCSVFHALFDNPVNAVQKMEIRPMKETDFQTFLKSNIAAREYDNDFNRNCNASSKCILSTNTNRTLVNSSPVSQTKISFNLDSHQSFCGNKHLHNQRTSNNDEQKTNMQITAEHLSALQNYLLFVTARDCSILMTFRELHPKNVSRVPAENTIKLSDQHYFLSSVRVSDLDPKSVHSINKHQQRDVDIFDSVISLLEKDINFTNR